MAPYSVTQMNAARGYASMNLQIDSLGDVKVVRLKEPSLVFPDLTAFSARVCELIEGGVRKLVIDLSDVCFLDSASCCCFMDIHRLMSEHGGAVKLAGLNERVEVMARMVGITGTVEVFRQERDAVQSF
jgi:anti-anti-sigma factor